MPTLHTEREPRAYDDLHDDDDEDYSMPHRYAAANGNDREISLGTGTILALFFALALVCSVFFGLGYTVGHKSTPPVTVASDAPNHSLSDAFKSFKPSPGGSADAKPTALSAPETLTPTSVVVPTTAAKPVVQPAQKKPFDPDAEIVTSVDPKPVHTAAPVVPSPSIAPTGTVIVQIAAVSHQEDADALLAALRRKGYTVAVHHEPQDKLLHLQLGPYLSKKDAEAMRVRLLADGYNSILK